MVLKKIINLDKFQYYVKHISIINALFIPNNFKLSLKEIEVIACFMKHTEGLGDEYILATVTRDKVMKDMEISHGGLSNYLRQFKQKGFLVDDKFHKMLYPLDTTNQEFNITLNVVEKKSNK